VTSGMLFALAIIVIVVVLIVFGALGGRGSVSPTGPYICPSCGTRGLPATKTKGSIFIEIILWLCLIVPGLIYSIWRLTTRQKVCPSCGNAGMIPIATPGGQQLAEQFAGRPTQARAALSSAAFDAALPDNAGMKTYRVVLDGYALSGCAPHEVRQRLARAPTERRTRPVHSRQGQARGSAGRLDFLSRWTWRRPIRRWIFEASAKRGQSQLIHHRTERASQGFHGEHRLRQSIVIELCRSPICLSSASCRPTASPANFPGSGRPR
jgi:hypothetical protein